MPVRFILGFLLISSCVPAQTTDDLKRVTHSSALTFVRRNGTCVRGALKSADATTITVEPFKQPLVVLKREDLLQVSQGNALLFSGRSSWNDVINTHLAPREILVLTLTNGKKIRGTPTAAEAASIKLKHGIKTTTIQKAEVQTVDYLRWRPESDSFDFMLQEAPYMVLFYPELYYRALGLEGRIPVRLYDASKPQDTGPSAVKVCPYSAPSPLESKPSL